MMMAAPLPEVGPTAQYLATTIPAPELPVVKPVVIDGSNTINLRAIGLFDPVRGSLQHLSAVIHCADRDLLWSILMAFRHANCNFPALHLVIPA
jgi:hypothetical protein